MKINVSSQFPFFEPCFVQNNWILTFICYTYQQIHKTVCCLKGGENGEFVTGTGSGGGNFRQL